jgi:autotransporter-associated beta strand protein
MAALLLAGQGALATTYTWTNTTSGSYTNPANWDLNAVPGISDTAIMAAGGTAQVDNTMTPLLTSLFMGGLDGSSGNITMSGGTFNVTNTGGTAFQAGYGLNSSGTFTLNGGTLTVARPSTGNRYYQDSFQPGQTIGSTGTITVNNGTLNILCGMEVGIDGTGIINVNGGTFMDNGWFTLGRAANANSVAPGSYTQSNGNGYHLRNPGTDSTVRIAYGANCNGTFTLSGGNFYCVGMKLCANNAAGVATLNVSDGFLYVSELGITAGTASGSVKNINISGGTFGTVYMDANATGQSGLSSVHPGGPGTNWTWAAANMPVVNLTNSPGFGQVIFVPDAGKTITLNNTWTGPGSFDLNGPGTLAIGGTNTYTGGTGMTQGTLLLNVSEPSSFISDIDVLGGTVALAAPQVSAPMGLVHFASGTTLQMNNNALIIDSTFTISNGVTLNFNGTVPQTFTNNAAGSGNVTVTMGGNGLELATGNFTHTGTTTIGSGTLVVGGTLNNSSGVLVTNTGTLAGGGSIGSPIVVSNTTLASAHLRMGNSPMNVPGTLTVNSLTLGSGSEVDFKLGNTTTTGSGVNDFLIVNGPLTINPNAFVNILPMQGLAAGSYVLIQYSTLTGQFTNTVTGLTRYGMSLDYSTPNLIKLNVTGSNANLVWRGTNTLWDVLTTSNWLNGASASTFAEGDAVTFDDTSTNHNVVLASTLYPASIVFNNASNYSTSGSGSGRISGGTGITKNGSGTVVLAAGLGLGNDYTGPVNINNGILKMNGALSLGATNGATTVAAGATLDINGQTPNDEPIILQGTGFGGTNGAINNTGGQPNLSGGPRRVTLLGDTTISAFSNRWDMGINTLGAGGGSFAGSGFKLTKNGTKDIWMHELGDIGVGDILVNQGTLGFQYTIGMGLAGNTITVMPGATFGIWQAPTLTKQTVLTNGATLYSDGASNALSGTITLYGTNTVLVNQPIGILSPIVGTGGYQKTGNGVLYLPAANTYSGSTIVNAGQVVLGPSGSIANSVLISLATNTVLDASQPAGGLSLGNGQTISGSGSVNGNVSAASGSQLSPGTPATAGTLSFNNNLTLNAATSVIKLSSDPNTIGGGVNDLVNVIGGLTLSGVSTIQINPLGVLNTVSPYSVMQYGSGSPTAANFHVVSGSPRYNVSLVDPTTTAPYVQVTLTGNPGVLVWKGGAASKPNIWDNSTTNWLNLGTGLRDAYFGGDQAILDDTGTTNLINLTTAAVGSMISLSNNTKAYTITGNGTIAGTLDMEGSNSVRLAISNAPNFTTITANSGTLIYDLQGVGVYTNTTTLSDNGGAQGTIVKAGTNIMILSALDNSAFSGTLVISNGTLQYTNAIDLGGSGSIYATNTGTLDLNGVASASKAVVVAGNGYNGQGALINSSTAGVVNSGVNNLTLLGDTTIGGTSRFDLGLSVFNGNDFKLTELGPSANLIIGGGDNNLGDIHVVAGRLGFQSLLVTMGDATKTATVESNAVLTLFNVNVTKNLVMNGYATLDSGGSPNTFNGAVTLNGPNNLFGLRVDLHLEGAVGGTGSLAVGNSPVGTGGGSLYLDAANTYSGSTTISNGHAIVVGAGSSLGASPRIEVDGGATLDVTAPPSFTFSAGQTLLGAGEVNSSNVVFGAGSTLAPGFPDNNTYTLVMIGHLTLQAGSTNLVVVKKTTSVANDTISGLTSVTMGGTLVINNVGNPLAAGDAIQLFSASSGYSGSFGQISPATPGSGLVWDLSTLNTDGKLRVGVIVQPVISQVVIAAGNVVLSGTNNGSSSTHYSVLSSTNVAQALNQWQSLVTNPFNPNGSFSWTNALVPGETRRFYRIQLQ